MTATIAGHDAWPDGVADVLIVGYGPVGQLFANVMALRGRRVVVVERHPRPYTMPRAVAFDGEAARILAAAGVADHLAGVGEPSGDYMWRNGEGHDLLSIGAAEVHGRNGWPESTSMYQPGLEEALIDHGRQLPGLTVLRGYEAVGLSQSADGAELAVTGEDGARRLLRARWVVGCDGANSLVRRTIGSEFDELGFHHEWLICDLVLHDQRTFVPNNLQICDPARPRTQVSAGPGHRRWEFMLLPGEHARDMDTRETAWSLLAEWYGITPDDGVMERHAVYAFQAATARRWRDGRLLIAGDAAHLMPPFAGQGMSSGFRDVFNLAWKLDLVLAGTASEPLLDTYAVERRAHVQHAIGMSVNLGKVICQTDPKAAADRDTVMITARERNLARPQQSPFQPLTKGLLWRDEKGRRRRGAGDQTPQPRVAAGAAEGLFDEVVGRGFAFVSLDDPRQLLGAGQLAFLASLDARLVRLLPEGTDPADAGPVGAGPVGEVVDVAGEFTAYLASVGARSVLVRPDTYAFGTAGDALAAGALVDTLRDALQPEMAAV